VPPLGTGAIRAPALILVAVGRGEPAPDEFCAELREREELVDVPLVLALEPEHLELSSDLVSVHEVLIRPYAPAELRARVARARRFAGGAEEGETVRIGALELNLVNYSVSVDGVPISFAYMEYELLKFLMTHPGRVFSREALLKRVWGYDYYGGARTVDVHVRRLRAKLGHEYAARIKTVRSVGYLFEGSPASTPRRQRTTAAAGAGRRSKDVVKVGFIALTDAAPVIMAYENGFYEKRGVEVQLIKQASWSATRDALLRNELDAAHCLFSLPFSVAMGIGGAAATNKLKVAMILNENGQAITLKRDWAGAGYDNPAKAKAVMNSGQGQTYAMTFPGGTHDTWLRYWLKAMGIDLSTPEIIPIPPSQMVANMKAGTMDGCCVGEPWGGVAAEEGIGFTQIATQDIWEFHPEKALVVNADFAAGRASDLKKVMGAILESASWLDFPCNRAVTAATISRPEYVDAPASVIEDRLKGVYELGGGLGTKTFTGDQMPFHRAGKANFPRRGHAIWFLAQYVRFRYLAAEPDYDAIAKDLILTDLYKEVAHDEGVDVPDDDMAPFEVVLDNVVFDPKKPHAEAIRA
jgi:nitrate/nitrite transport system substrate-binding protein